MSNAEPHGLSIKATHYGTIFVRGEDTAMELSVEQADSLCARLLDALSHDDGGTGSSSRDGGIAVFAHQSMVHIHRHKPLSAAQVHTLVTDIGAATDMARAMTPVVPKRLPAPEPDAPQLTAHETTEPR